MKPRLLLALLPFLLLAADWPGHPENRWVQQSPAEGRPAPPFGWEGSGAYDPSSRKWIHFGGHDGIPQGFHLFTYDLEAGTWGQRFPPTSPPGVCCIDGANTFDVANRRFVNFPGGSLGHGYQWSRGVLLKRSAVWLYDPAGNEWTNMRPAPYRRPFTAADNIGGLNAGAAYHPVHEISISFGGQGSSGGTGNLHFYDAYANRLTRVTAAGAPSPRDGMGVCVDTKNDCLVVFGSQYASDEKTYLYRFRTGQWEAHDLRPRPNARKGKTYSTIPRLAYDAHNGICLGLIWDDATGAHETWALDVARLQWAKRNPPAEPDASMSRSRNLGFSAEHNVFVLELSPAALKGKGAQVWTYRYRNAPQSTTVATPANLRAVTRADAVALTWDAPPEAAGYHVYRAAAAEPWRLHFEKIGACQETSFEDRKVTPGSNHVYTVRAVSRTGGESADSPRARSEPRVALRPVVSVPARDRVEVTWKPHPARDVAGYNVYRGRAVARAVTKANGTAWKDNDPEYAEPTVVEVKDITDIQKLNDKLLTGTAFVDAVELTRAGAGQEEYRYAVYAYIVRAVNLLGVESGPSPYALTIPSEPTGVFNRDKGPVAELKWDANPEKGVVGYRVYKLEGTWGIVRLTPEPIQGTTFTHRGGPTRFWVAAVDALGQQGQPSSPVWHQRSYQGFYQGEWHQ